MKTFLLRTYTNGIVITDGNWPKMSPNWLGCTSLSHRTENEQSDRRVFTL